MALLTVMGASLVAAVLLAFIGDRKFAPEINIAGSAATFAASLLLAFEVYEWGPFMAGGDFFFVDAFNVYLTVLTAFVSMTTAIFSRRYMRHERSHGRIGHKGMRFYHAMFQLFIFTMLLALLTNNIGVLWIAMELATLSTVLLVSLYRTPAAIEAAWKYFILCGVGIAQALFGTVLLYFAAEKIFGDGSQGILWTNLSRVAGDLEPTVLSLAFIFFMVGYGTKVGLVPLHNWLPDAHSEGPTPISAVLSGLLLNVALYALVRCKVLVDGATHSNKTGYIMMAFGLISILVASFSLLRQKDIKRLFAYSSIEHMGIATFAFGLGGPVATFGALLHMLVHSLTKSAIFFTAGHAAQMHSTQDMTGIKGLIRGNPLVGWGLIFGVIAIAGMPPFGVFTSEFLILTAAMKTAPYLTPLFLLGIGVAFAAMFRKVMPMVFGEAPPGLKPLRAAHIPVMVHIALVLLLGLYLPGFLSEWFHTAAELLR
ncbi:MAG TPA: hydrogenase 4 subunit F [Deltaproteobacteria bacterium]|nr:MAG: hydrogenase 4 subunit F [Deltaproteobacteria bacterium GWA2_55_82]OGQ64873.1 MAG: hydrogenase 4 subunit F [Deltaproteobacteria bacterium RIFCSPLOWO2_02_FULL_55_12]OIJ73940.1 MAG: hydrogenase 4 subunit F [Deltaproteobacteria bacterium GWC2_55_46]HBG46535.1 hydrogenase 4 subunit F [Deltaproteobacteria bacterium]HCY09937.1 hydrogenase 4 subunit F [Deltaproteobacteria bacterium]